MGRFFHLVVIGALLPTASAQYYVGNVVAGVDFPTGQTGKATSLPLIFPRHIAIDLKDNLYIADYGGGGVAVTWRVTPSGLVDARYQYCCVQALSGVSIDSAGAIYLLASPDLRTFSIIKADSAGVSTLANNVGSTVWSATGAGGLALDRDGNVYVGAFDIGVGGRISKVTPSGAMSTLTNLSLYASGVAWRNGLAYFTENGIVKSVDKNGTVSHLGAVANSNGLAVDKDGNVFVAAWTTVQKLMPDGTIVKVAGTTTGSANSQSGPNGDGGPAILAPLGHAMDVALNSGGDLYIASSSGNFDAAPATVRKVVGGLIGTVAGNIDPTVTATSSPLLAPWNLATLGEELYIQDGFSPMRRVSSDGHRNEISTSAPGLFTIGAVAAKGAVHVLRPDAILQIQPDGSLEVERPIESLGIAASYVPGGLRIGGLAADNNGNYYILAVSQASGGNTSLNIWKSSPDGSTKVLLVSPPASSWAATDIGTDASGNLYIAQDTIVRKMSPAGVVSTVAGTGVSGFAGDGGPATSSQLNGASGVAIDATGRVYIADSNNRRVRMVDTDGTIRTIYFTPSAEPFGPDKVRLDATGGLYVLETRNGLVRKLLPNPAVRVNVVRGDGQRTPAGSALPIPLAVQVVGQTGAPAEGLSVAWKVTLGDATVAAGASITDPTGTATINVTLGKTPGPVTITASVGNLPPVQFTATATDVPSRLKLLSGDGQNGPPGGSLPVPLALQVIGLSGSPISGVAVTFAVTSGAATLSAGAAVTGEDGSARVTVTLGAVPGVTVVTATVTGLAPLQFRLTGGPVRAVITAVVGAGGSVPPVTQLSPGGLATIYGTNLAPAGTERQVGPAHFPGGGLPLALAGTCVYLCSGSCGYRAPITYVSATQVNFQVPDIPLSAAASVTVSTSCGTASQSSSDGYRPVRVQAASPEFLYWIRNATGNNPVVAVNALTGTYVGLPGLIPGLTFLPAKPGDYLTIYGISFGPTSPLAVPGLPSASVAPTTASPTVILGAAALEGDNVAYAGASPGTTGLYQVNIRIPNDLPNGDYPIVLRLGSFSTPSGGFISVRH